MYIIGIGNHIISSAIWNKQARVNFSKTNKIARARAYLFQIAREKSCGYLLIVYMEKFLNG